MPSLITLWKAIAIVFVLWSTSKMIVGALDEARKFATQFSAIGGAASVVVICAIAAFLIGAIVV